jgi:hypothetical protein
MANPAINSFRFISRLNIDLWYWQQTLIPLVSGTDTDPSVNLLINIKKSVCVIVIGVAVPQMADEAFVDSSVRHSMARGLHPLVLITLID